MAETPQTDFMLAGELIATATFISAMHVNAGVHIDRLARAVDFLRGMRPDTPYDIRALVRNDDICHAIYTLGVREGQARIDHERLLASGGAPPPEPGNG